MSITSLTTNQDLDAQRLREAFGVFPSGVVAVASEVDGDLIEQYAEVGIEEFVLSGYPHLEESYWFGEGVLPELTRRGLWEHPVPPKTATAAVPFGSSKAAS